MCGGPIVPPVEGGQYSGQAGCPTANGAQLPARQPPRRERRGRAQPAVAAARAYSGTMKLRCIAAWRNVIWSHSSRVERTKNGWGLRSAMRCIRSMARSSSAMPSAVSASLGMRNAAFFGSRTPGESGRVRVPFFEQARDRANQYVRLEIGAVDGHVHRDRQMPANLVPATNCPGLESVRAASAWTSSRMS